MKTKWVEPKELVAGKTYKFKPWGTCRSLGICEGEWNDAGVLKCIEGGIKDARVNASDGYFWGVTNDMVLEEVPCEDEQDDDGKKRRKYFGPGAKFKIIGDGDELHGLDIGTVVTFSRPKDKRDVWVFDGDMHEYFVNKSNLERYGRVEQADVPAAKEIKSEKEDGKMGLFEQAIDDMVVERIKGAVAPLKADIEKMLAEKIQRFEIKVADLPFKKVEGAHEAFKEVLLLACNRIPTMLVGPAGCGKTTLAKSIADHLEMDFSAVSCTGGMGESHLTGWLVPTENGKFEFIESELLKRFENGGVILLDEIDAADANTLLIMNSMIANGYMFLPQRRHKPMATRHKDCIIIAAANTMGDGTSFQYAGREKLDEATLDRFRAGIVFMNYDKKIENAVCPDLADWATKMRDKMTKARVDRCLSTRFIIQAKTVSIAKQESPIPCAEEMFFRTWSKEEKERVK